MWIDDIKQALINLGGFGHYTKINEEIKNIRMGHVSANWQAVVRRTIQQHSSDSQSYLGKEDLFYSVNGIGRGTWGLRKYFPHSEVPNDILINGINNRHDCIVRRIIRDTALSAQLKEFHNDTCQICGLRLKIGPDKFYSEGHHIQGLGSPHNGPDIAENIIVLCPNCHVLCDNHQIELTSEMFQRTGRSIGLIFVEYHNKIYYDRNGKFLNGITV